MMKYELYQVEDLVLDDSFRNWILGREHRDEVFWRHWLKSHQEMKPVVDEARYIIKELEVEELRVSQQEIDRNFEEISEFFDSSRKQENRSRSLRFISRVAASVLVLIMAGAGAFYLFDRQEPAQFTNYSMDQLSTAPESSASGETANSQTSVPAEAGKQKQQDHISDNAAAGSQAEASQPKASSSGARDQQNTNPDKAQPATASFTRYATMEGEKQKITLPDGSRVYMNENSTLAFSSDWSGNTERRVRLTGEAFFQVEEKVHRGEKVKFVVTNQDVTVEVVGTEFDFRENSKGTSVYLNSGKVRLILRAMEQVIHMEPGDLIEYNASTGNITSTNTEQIRFISWLGAFAGLDHITSRMGFMTTGDADARVTRGQNNNLTRILQDGDGNNAYVEQIGENLKSTQVQKGQSNTAEAVFSGSNKKDQTDDADWSTWQLQHGAGNVSIFNLVESYNTNIYSGQAGIENKVHATSKGRENAGLILQYGLDNEAILIQEGQQNKALILQGQGSADGLDPGMLNGNLPGRYNEVNIIQHGQQNQARTVQQGSNNKAEINQKEK